MIVYKYKSLGNTTCTLEQEKQLGYLKDICMKNQLYAADFNELDDPMEGVFCSERAQEKEVIRQITNRKQSTHICSLSPTYQSMLMWSFYANEHKGCCIEIEIPDNGNYRVENVRYVEDPINFDLDNFGRAVDKNEILLRKFKDWAFEKELRILTHERFVHVSVRRIYLGMRIPNDMFDKLKTEIEEWRGDIHVERMRENMFVHIDTSVENN